MVVVWLLVLIGALPVLSRVDEPMKVGGFSSDDTEAAQARWVLEQELGLSSSSLVVIYQSDTLQATDPAFLDQVEDSLRDVESAPGVTNVILPSAQAQLISDDGSTAYAIVGVDLPPEEAQRDVPAFKDVLRDTPDLKVLVAGGPAFYADIETVSQRDLRRAELIAFPFAALALLLVFGSMVAAAVPLTVGGLGVAAVLLSLYGIAHATDLSIFVLNLATMLGLGLAVDYSLFITSRYREELAKRDGDVATTVEATIGTAGRAIFFSGMTVLIGLLGLTLFSFMFLRSVGIAGSVVVLFSVLAALTLLPAVLSIIGTRIDRLRVIRQPIGDEASERGFWARLARRVMAHPVLVLIPTLVLLLVLGTPFLNVSVSSPDATILPSDLPSRQGFDILTEEYGAGEISPFVIAVRAPSSFSELDNIGALYDLAEWLRSDPRVVRVQSAVTFEPPVSRGQSIALFGVQQGLEDLGVETGARQLASEQTAMVLAYTRDFPNAPENKDLLDNIRSYQTNGDLDLLVDGSTAEIVDVVDVMYGEFPVAVALIVGATYLILLVLFRSVVLPIKAILMNTLSILASYGALVFIFQDGHFEQVLDFTALGFVEASLPVIMFCVLFGLSMDYEVFLLSRVREEWERTGDNQHSVAVGLQRSGRIITSAALIVVVVTASFVSADVILIKALGFGIALAVLLDATIVRALLVPATMRLLGDWNWWMPSGLRRLLPSRTLIEEPTDL
ncbi:MAG: MMPL family transporter [Thermomicrobiales bacterium]